MIGILSFFAILFINCNDDDSSPALMCENGFQPIDGNCQCPDGHFQAYGTCRELTDDEWYGIMEGCLCEDTMFVKIRNIENGEARIKFNDNLFIKIGEPLLPGGGGQVKYFEMASGDSIAPKNLPYGLLTCDVNDDIAVDYEGALYGKISPSRDKIDLLIEWRVRQNPNAIFDSCYVTFRK